MEHTDYGLRENDLTKLFQKYLYLINKDMIPYILFLIKKQLIRDKDKMKAISENEQCPPELKLRIEKILIKIEKEYNKYGSYDKIDPRYVFE